VKDTEWVLRGLFKSLVVDIMLCAFCIQEFLNPRKMQNSHGTLTEKISDKRTKWLLCGLDPDIAVNDIENIQRAFCTVLWREKEGLLKLKTSR
jgi:hypothetical protein